MICLKYCSFVVRQQSPIHQNKLIGLSSRSRDCTIFKLRKNCSVVFVANQHMSLQCRCLVYITIINDVKCLARDV